MRSVTPRKWPKSSLGNLERLNLNLTEITDAGLQSLESLPKLKYVEVFGTNTSKGGIAGLKKALPDIEVRVTRNF